jgi:guanine deaminase
MLKTQERFAVRGPVLRVNDAGGVELLRDGVLVVKRDRFDGVGEWRAIGRGFEGRVIQSAGVMMPPMVDVHTHIPQWPIRGRFVEGVPVDVEGGQLLAGLKKNVFPVEIKTREEQYTTKLVDDFAKDTLSHGVVGGSTFLTPFVGACQIALRRLDKRWSVGLVLMNQNCPEDLRTDEANLERDVLKLQDEFGSRVVMSDRFAVAVSSDLRQRASALARQRGLFTQTHLNEQVGEKRQVENVLYPNARSYAHVYGDDGLFDSPALVAHCIEMRDEEWQLLKDKGCAIAHCPTSNLLLGSNTMNLEEVLDRQIPLAIATDVGASPTQSMLAEMRRFMQVHRARGSTRATAERAMYLATRAGAKILGLDLCLFEADRPASWVEVVPIKSVEFHDTVASVIDSLLPTELENPKSNVTRVWLDGACIQSTVD